MTKALLRPVADNVVDVFLGEGWENWTRFEIKRMKGKVFLKKLNGKPLKEQEFKDLCMQLQ